MGLLRAALAAGLVVGAGAALADEPGCDVHDYKDARLCTYEANTLGVTWDNDDVRFMDFKISIRYQLFPETLTKLFDRVADNFGYKYSMYLAFTGRFGQYIGTRDSSPVIGKRFNPKLFIRRWLDAPDVHEDYFDFAYGHESNGQAIHTAAQYAQAQSSAQRPDFANDQLSRGWDYLEIAWRKTLRKDRSTTPADPERPDRHEYLASLLTLKYFLPNGLLQGAPEDYNGIENSPQGKPRRSVNGIAESLKYYQPTAQHWGFRDVKAVLGYETGYNRIFTYSTWRTELGTKVAQLPVSFWYQTGYNSDLAQYYKKVSSKGIQIEIGSF